MRYGGRDLEWPCTVYVQRQFSLMAQSHWQWPRLRQRPIKNGLYRIVWRCTHCTETETETDSHWVLYTCYRSRSRPLSVWLSHEKWAFISKTSNIQTAWFQERGPIEVPWVTHTKKFGGRSSEVTYVSADLYLPVSILRLRWQREFHVQNTWNKQAGNPQVKIVSRSLFRVFQYLCHFSAF